MDLRRFHHEKGPKGFVGIHMKRIDFQNNHLIIELSYSFDMSERSHLGDRILSGS